MVKQLVHQIPGSGVVVPYEPEGDISGIVPLDQSRVPEIFRGEPEPGLGLECDLTTLPRVFAREWDGEDEDAGLERRPILDFEKTFGGAWLVSERVRRIVESLEPDTHQFAEIGIRFDGEIVARHYFMVICTQLDAAHPEHVRRPDLVLRSAKVAGNHLWVEKICKETFASEKLADRLKEAGVTGLRYMDTKEIGGE